MSALNRELRQVALALYQSLDTPRSLTCTILVREQEWDQLANLGVDPSHYLEGPWGAAAYYRDSQASNFLRKSPLLPVERDKVAAAVEVFHACEEACAITNYTLERLSLRRLSSDISPIETRLISILDDAAKIVARILGKVPDSLPGRFGPGTCFGLKGSVYKTIADKVWIKNPLCTPAAVALFEHDYYTTSWWRSAQVLNRGVPGTTRGNYFTTVPKDATKDRGICVEPEGNLWCQLGVGSYWKHRAACVGLHIGRASARPVGDPRCLLFRPSREGQSVHQELAREGSLKGTWATCDFSNASDTLAYELIRWVFSKSPWWPVIDALRSPKTLIEGKWTHLHKFSSMGNGFTFELESVVIAAIAAAATGLEVGKDVVCYGDDLIVPSIHADSAMAALTAVGMFPNARKSFTTGPFRESCGGDFFSGIGVRSCYADSELEQPTDWMVLHNQLRVRGASRLVLRRCEDAVPSRLRIHGPSFLGDRVFHKTEDRCRHWVRDGMRKWLVLVPMHRRVPLDRWGTEFLLTLALLGVRNRVSSQVPTISPRGEPVGFRVRLTAFS